MPKLACLDPRIKLLFLLGISTVSILSRSHPTLLALLAFTLFILISGGVSLVGAFLRVRTMLKLILMLFILQCIFNRSGEVLLAVQDVVLVTKGGFSTAVLVTLRLMIILLSALIVLTGETRDYLLALTQCHIPYEISFMVLVALRFIPLLRDEARDVLCAVQMRGTRLKKTGLKNKASVYVSVMLPIVAGAIQRSEQLSIAMEARGFRAFPSRTSMRKLRFGMSDLVSLLVFALALISIIILL